MSTATATVSKYKVGQTYQLPPKMLLLERNIREAKPSADLIASIKDVGVLEPISAVITTDGQLLVRFGQRRTLGAIEAKVATVPVYVRGNDDGSDVGEVDRIITQRAENTHRDGLTTAEDVRAVEQLVAFGMPAEEISKRTQITPTQVGTALKVAGSKMATKAAAKWEALSLEQAAAIAEFEDDPKDVEKLVQAAHAGTFEHTVQRMRDDREEAIKHAACMAAITALGVEAISKPPSWDDKATKEDRLVDAKTDKKVTPSAHAKCPGRVAWPAWNGSDFEPEYGCKDPKKNGHRDSWKSGGSASRPTVADLSEEEREAAKAQRKLVVDNNKAWTSAEKVRRDWLATLAKRTTPPKGAAAFIAGGISRDTSQFNYANGVDTLTTELLGPVPSSDRGHLDLAALATKGSESRALVIALVRMLGIYETNLDTSSWRKDGASSEAGRYLRFLQSTGYTLSDVELYAISKNKV